MKILIVGLGLIGGSYAMGLSRMGHQVYGMDQNLQALVYAKQKGYIQEEDFKVEEANQKISKKIKLLQMYVV